MRSKKKQKPDLMIASKAAVDGNDSLDLQSYHGMKAQERQMYHERDDSKRGRSIILREMWAPISYKMF